MFRRSFAALLTVFAVAVAGFATPTPAQAANDTPSALSFPVTAAGATGVFNGTLKITSFGVENGQLVASGLLTGTVVNAAGVASAVARSVTMPVNTGVSKVARPQAKALACEVLHLELGPLDLNLLGLVVHLDKVVLDISAVPGGGNLLGNLLCAVTNLLNGAGTLLQIANLLNQILGLLG